MKIKDNHSSDIHHKVLTTPLPYYLKKIALSHPNAPKDVIWRALDHPDTEIRYAAAMNPSNDSDILNKMVRHSDPGVAFRAIHHVNATPEHFGYLLDSDHTTLIKRTAVEYAVSKGMAPLWLKMKALHPKNIKHVRPRDAVAILQGLTHEEKNSPEGHEMFKNAIKSGDTYTQTMAAHISPIQVHHEILAEPISEENPESNIDNFPSKHVVLNAAFDLIDQSNSLSETDRKEQLDAHAKTIEMGLNHGTETVRQHAKMKIRQLIQWNSASERHVSVPYHYETIRSLAQKAGLEDNIPQNFEDKYRKSKELHKQS